jgi:hypothetical protein
MEGIKDSSFVDFTNSIDVIQRKLATPKKRGVRAVQGDDELDNNLKNDIVSIITSPLSQLWKLEPIPALSAAQVEALRALYALVKDESNLDEGLVAVLEAAIKLLNPTFTSNSTKDASEDQNDNGDGGTSKGRRRIYAICIDNISRRAVYISTQKRTIGSAAADSVWRG